MRTIQIDANLVHDENGEIYLSTAVVEYFNLCDGEKVLAYEGNEIWNAVIHKFVLENKELWYVELCDLFGTMNQYQEEWNNIGYQNGFCTGAEIEKSKIIQNMISNGFCMDEIEKVINLNEELKERVKKLLQGNI
jgi:hypothetical protein